MRFVSLCLLGNFAWTGTVVVEYGVREEVIRIVGVILYESDHSAVVIVLVGNALARQQVVKPHKLTKCRVVIFVGFGITYTIIIPYLLDIIKSIVQIMYGESVGVATSVKAQGHRICDTLGNKEMGDELY